MCCYFLYKYYMNFEQYVNEALKVKYVIRGKKRVKKWKSTKDNYRVEYDSNGKPKEVRITAKEHRKRKLGQRKGKIKRAAKQNLIELKRKKSFVARKNMGIAYNKKLPDKHGPDFKSTYIPKKKDNLLSPKFENIDEINFQDYLFEHAEQLLLEWPEGIIYSNDDFEVGWDWCSETTPEDGGWLWQLVIMYKYKYLDTLRNDRNEPINQNGYMSDHHLELTNAEIKEITENLINDYFFIQQANVDYQLIDNELKSEMDKWIPKELLSRIIKGVV